MARVVEVTDLTLVRGGRTLFRGLSFGVGAGEALAVVGPNGAGKTSLLRALAGVLPPDRGAIRVCAPAGTGVAVGWLGIDDGLKAQMTVGATLAFYRDLYGCGGGTLEALHRVGLVGMEAVPVYRLSSGQRRRLAFARLLMMDARVWLLDEPFSLLDAQARAAAMQAMRTHVAGGGGVVAATHEPLGLGERTLRLGE